MKSLMFAVAIFAMLSHQASVQTIGFATGRANVTMNVAMGNMAFDVPGCSSFMRAASMAKADIVMRIGRVEAALNALGAALG